VKRFVVIGLGGFGSWVARLLFREGYDVIAIDRNETLVDRSVGEVTRAVAGDATDPALLREVGADGAQAAVVSTGDDLASSILAILALKDVGVGNIYVKVPNPRAAEALARFDLTDMVFPEREAAERLVHRLSSTAILDYIPVGKDFAIEEIAIPDPWVGRSLGELALPATEGIQVVAIFDVLQGHWNPVPGPDQVLKESDIALVAGKTEVLKRVVGDRGRNPRHR
jgi:trk system potassium uptake protein TrkA